MNLNLASRIFLVLLISILASCSEKVIPSKPVTGQFDTPPQPKESMVQIPVTIPIDDINKFIEKSVPQVIYSGKETGTEQMMVNLLVGKVEKEYGWEVKYTVKKNGKMTFTVDKKGVITFVVPLRVDAEGCASISLGTNIRKCGQSSPELDLVIKTKINIKPDWQVNSTTIVAYDIKKADLIIPFQLGDFPLFNLKLNIKEDLQKPIDAQLKSMATEIDKYIASYVKDMNIKELAAKYWADYSTSMNLTRNPPLYLNIQPRRIFMDDLTNLNNNLSTSLGISAILSLSSAPQSIEKTPLPKIEHAKLGNTSSLLIPVSYDYDSLELYLENLYKDTTLIGDGYKLTVKGINIFGMGKYVIVDLKYNAKIKGVLKKVKGNMFFRTLPAFDSKTNTFYLEECVMTSETNSILTDRGLKYLANKSLNKDIMNMAKYDLSKDLKNAILMINSEIKSLKMGNLELNGVVDKIEFEGFYVEPNRINIYFMGLGKVKSKVLLLN